jgi:hypothetical protein
MKTTTLPVYDSLAACAGATKIPAPTLRKWKRAGCPAFQGSRVSLAGLLEWLFTGAHEDDGVDWPLRLKRAQAERAELQLAKERETVVEKADVIAQIREFNAKARAVLQQKLEVELPARCAGQPAADIMRHGKQVLREVCDILGKVGA